jgi:hypothetical protein
MWRKIHGTNLLRLKFLGRTNVKCQNGPVFPPAQVFFLKVICYNVTFHLHLMEVKFYIRSAVAYTIIVSYNFLVTHVHK